MTNDGIADGSLAPRLSIILRTQRRPQTTPQHTSFSHLSTISSTLSPVSQPPCSSNQSTRHPTTIAFPHFCCNTTRSSEPFWTCLEHEWSNGSADFCREDNPVVRTTETGGGDEACPCRSHVILKHSIQYRGRTSQNGGKARTCRQASSKVFKNTK